MISWKYDILFSFNITHPGSREDEFYLKPSAECQRLLKRFGLIFKPLSTGGLVLQEKRVNPDASLTVIRPFQETTPFTFILYTSNPALLSVIKPFHSTMPPFSGRRRIIYLHNLNAGQVPDTDLDFPAQTTTIDTDLASRLISADTAISIDDLASLTPNKFSILADPSATSQITLAAKRPDPPANQTFPVSTGQNNISLDLESGAFQMDKTGSENSSEVIFADTNTWTANLLGIIQIFKNSATDYNTTIRYDIIFEKA